jgi:mRNA-degrading endonuclease RelE of RelBE toxin-antitoxin system
VSYQIDYSEEAYDDLANLPARYRKPIKTLIEALGQNPYPSRSKRLRDPLAHYHQARLDPYRIIYRVVEAEREILIVRVKLKDGPETYDDLI